MLSYGTIKNFGGGEDTPSPPQGAKKWQFVYLQKKTMLKMLGNDT